MLCIRSACNFKVHIDITPCINPKCKELNASQWFGSLLVLLKVLKYKLTYIYRAIY